MNETPLKQTIVLTIPRSSISEADEKAAIDKLEAAGLQVVVLRYNASLPIPSVMLLPS